MPCSRFVLNLSGLRFYLTFPEQPGDPRSAATMLAVIEQQLHLACLGVKDSIDALQTATGVKDKIAQYWIEKLIFMAREKEKIKIKDVATRDQRLNDRGLKAEG
jgi:hypothetical protein